MLCRSDNVSVKNRRKYQYSVLAWKVTVFSVTIFDTASTYGVVLSTLSLLLNDSDRYIQFENCNNAFYFPKELSQSYFKPTYVNFGIWYLRLIKNSAEDDLIKGRNTSKRK